MMDKIKSIFCVLFGHSRIHEQFFGYYYCGRCGDEVGDSLMGFYSGKQTVQIGHDCPVCFENYKKMTWRDKFLAPYPFTSDHPLTEAEFATRRKEAMVALHNAFKMPEGEE